MVFCKKINLCVLILLLLCISAGCSNHADKSDFFHRDSAYDSYKNKKSPQQIRRVGNVIYLGSSTTQKEPDGISFEFEDLRR